jgi:hypothetical protein
MKKTWKILSHATVADRNGFGRRREEQVQAA